MSRPSLAIPLTAGYLPEMGETPETHGAYFQQQQNKAPICYRHHSQHPFWEVFRYDDVEQVLSDHETFSVEYRRLAGMSDFDMMSNSDPPLHRKFRALVSKAFTPRRIEQLAPRITAIVDTLLDRVTAHGKMDLTQDFAYPLPVQVIAEMLGIPSDRQEDFRRWSYQLLGILPTDDPQHRALGAFFAAQLEQRAREPQDDLMSALLTAEVDGERLTREQVIAMCEGLLIAGNVTTTTLLNHAVLRFDQEHGIFEELHNDPSLIPGAIEEVLRYQFSLANMPRLVRCDTVLAGQVIKKGEVVLAWIGAANFDETYFFQATTFDIRRSPNRHLSFGYGIHYCLGAPLARLEGKIALERCVDRLRDLRCDPDHSVSYLEKRLGLIQSLPLLFKHA